MFGFRKRNPQNNRPKNVRARDGLVRRTSAERRSVCKHGGLTKKAQRQVVKKRRAYYSGKRTYRGETW
jgi:hypothetical protein